ncbi:DUF4232 domain-containing protein [Actinophytocola sp. NPDC049390]|uniref:DUF4232 domain-containing protein n=1 Tax=Actinophytocola sp. NPDC049390 TaxID=3363894 RepID=UPI0037A0AB3A
MTMLRTRISAGVIISGAMLLLTACNTGGTDGSGSPDVPTINDSATSQPAEPPPTTSSNPPSPPRTSQAVQPPVSSGQDGVTNDAECKVADLKLSLRDGDAAAGTFYRSLVFTNKGSRTCTIQGFAGVSYVAGDDGHQVGPAAYRVGRKGPAVTLKPGDSASAAVGFVQVRNYDPAECKPTDVRGLRVYPPHEYDSMFVPSPGTGCAGDPPGNQLTVATVKPGTGGGA